MICPNPNCHYQGPPKKSARGNWIVLFVLLSLFILPGLVYLLACGGYRYRCPNCGLQIASDN